MFQIGVYTPNEIRKELDMNNLDYGDNSFVQVNMQTLKQFNNNQNAIE